MRAPSAQGTRTCRSGPARERRERGDPDGAALEGPGEERREALLLTRVPTVVVHAHARFTEAVGAVRGEACVCGAVDHAVCDIVTAQARPAAGPTDQFVLLEDGLILRVP